jgi:N-acetylmuramoyl-L-alanine amidase
MPKPLGTIKFLTIHCAATPRGRPHTAKEVSAWDIARFGQVSYHYVVELDGKVTATLPDTLLGAHTGGHNTGNIGVCYVGGLESVTLAPADTRTPEQKQAIRDIVARYRARVPALKVKGHRDWSPDRNGDGKITPDEFVKSCPCFNVATDL